MWVRSELKARAREILNLNYWKAVLVSLIYMFLTGGGSGGGSVNTNTTNSTSDTTSIGNPFSSLSSDEIAGMLFGAVIFIAIFLVIFALALAFSFFVLSPLQVGCHRFFIRCEYGTGTLDDVVFAFTDGYMNVVKTMFFQALYVSLWSLLFVIPGIVKSYEYRMIPYILAENPHISTKEAFALSKQMMEGDKGNAFVLDLSFIGWNILSAFTCCILAIFYVAPYQNLTNAQLYAVLKNKVSGYNHQNSESNYTYTNCSNPYQQ